MGGPRGLQPGLAPPDGSVALQLLVTLVLDEPCFACLRTFNQGQREGRLCCVHCQRTSAPGDWLAVLSPALSLSHLCRLTGHYKERPHLYIRNPLDSIVLEVQVGTAAGTGVRGPLRSRACPARHVAGPGKCCPCSSFQA